MEAFFMFHRAIGSDDEMATVAERTEKLLFYTSTCDDDLEEQLERVGLCEAFIDLCQSFRAKAPCESVFLDDHQYSMLECEPDTWLVVCCKSDVEPQPLNEGIMQRSSYSTYKYQSSAEGSSKRSPIQKLSFRRGQKKQDQERKKLYKSSTLRESQLLDRKRPLLRLMDQVRPDPDTLQSVMHQFYAIFTLFHGRIDRLLLDNSSSHQDVPNKIKQLRKRLRKSRHIQQLIDEGDLVPDQAQQAMLDSRAADEDFLGTLLAASTADNVRQLLLPMVSLFLDNVDFFRLHVLYNIRALPFLSVGKSTFMTAQLFMTCLDTRFPGIICSGMLLHSGQVLWTSIPENLAETVFGFLAAYNSSNGGAREANAQAGGEGAPASELKTKAGFLKIGQSVRSPEHATPTDSADMYFPVVFNIYSEQTHRMAVYGIGKLQLVIFTPDLTGEPLEGGREQCWDKSGLLDFCGEFESYVMNEMTRLAEVVSSNFAPANHTQTSSSNLFFLPYTTSASNTDHSTPGDGTATSALGSTSQGPETADRYLYLNQDKSVVKISDAWLATLPSNAIGATNSSTSTKSSSSARKEAIFPSNVVFGQMLPLNVSDSINNTRRQFESCKSPSMFITVFVRPNSSLNEPGCWVVALKSMSRQVFLLVDSKHSFEFASHRMRVLKDTALRSIFI